MLDSTIMIQCPTCGETDEVTELSYRNADKLCCRHCNRAADKARFKAYMVDSSPQHQDSDYDMD